MIENSGYSSYLAANVDKQRASKLSNSRYLNGDSLVILVSESQCLWGRLQTEADLERESFWLE
jgi:hypothetical protein